MALERRVELAQSLCNARVSSASVGEAAWNAPCSPPRSQAQRLDLRSWIRRRARPEVSLTSAAGGGAAAGGSVAMPASLSGLAGEAKVS